MDELLYDETMMRNMIERLRQNAKSLEDTRDNVMNVAKRIGGEPGSEGALVGSAGQSFKSAINKTLCSAIEQIIDDYYTQADIVECELNQHLDSQSRFE